MLKNLLKKAGVVVAGTVASVSAFAQTATPFDTAITDITTKVSTYGGALVGLAAAGVAFGVGIKYIKKIRGAA